MYESRKKNQVRKEIKGEIYKDQKTVDNYWNWIILCVQPKEHWRKKHTTNLGTILRKTIH